MHKFISFIFLGHHDQRFRKKRSLEGTNEHERSMNKMTTVNLFSKGNHGGIALQMIVSDNQSN